MEHRVFPFVSDFSFVSDLQALGEAPVGREQGAGQRPTTGRDFQFRWFLRLVETSVEASDDRECSGEPRTARVF